MTTGVAVLGEDGDEFVPREARPVKAGCFTRAIIKCPCGMALATMILSLAVSWLAVRQGGTPELVQRAGWSNDNSPVVASIRAVGGLKDAAVTPGAATSSADTEDETVYKPLERGFTSTMLLYDARDPTPAR